MAITSFREYLAQSKGKAGEITNACDDRGKILREFLKNPIVSEASAKEINKSMRVRNLAQTIYVCTQNIEREVVRGLPGLAEFVDDEKREELDTHYQRILLRVALLGEYWAELRLLIEQQEAEDAQK